MSYRVFISYSHADSEAANQIAAILRRNGLWVLWDQDFAKGSGFHAQIKNYIAHSHVFLPVLTKGSSERGWVHQEIGYAMALNVPVLPVALDVLPGQMLDHLHAVHKTSDPDWLGKGLEFKDIEQLVMSSANSSQALFECAEFQEQRSQLIARHAEDVLKLKQTGRVRHRGGLTAFDLPDRPIIHPLWTERYGGKPRSEYQLRLLREERKQLGRHAEAAGCSLMFTVAGTFDQYAPGVRRSRLNVLRNFLDSMSDDKVVAVVNNDLQHGENLLMVGDWFVAMSAAARQGSGFRQTILSRHAPTMRQRVREFDDDMEGMLEAARIRPEDSRRAAIKAIDEVLAEIGGRS